MSACRAANICLILLAAAMCTGCTVGPDYCRPAAPVSPQWIDSNQQPELIGQCANASDWWYSFNDPDLVGLINATHQQNLDLKSAGMRIAQSRAQLRIAAGNKFPQLQQMYGAYDRNGLSKNTAFVPPNRFFDNWGTGFDAAWELDFWGRFERAIESANGEYNATIEDYDNLLVVLLGEVGATYVQMRTFQQRLDFARTNLKIQRETLGLAEVRFKEGATTELDVKQAQSNVSQTEALLPVLETGVRQTNNALCVLTGIPPRDLTLQDVALDRPIPMGPPTVSLGIPADLVRQRPDVRAAERKLAAQSARIGIAESDLYPHISIIGTVGLQSANFSSLFDGDSFTGVIGPAFSWNILNYGRLRSNIDAQRALFQQLAYAYQQSVIEAQREVEDALVGFQKSQTQVQSLQDSVKAAKEAVDIGTTQYRLGKVDFNRVFLLQTELVRQQDLLASAQGDQARNLISVYKALGGGWRIRLQNGQPVGILATEFIDEEMISSSPDDDDEDASESGAKDKASDDDADSKKSTKETKDAEKALKDKADDAVNEAVDSKQPSLDDATQLNLIQPPLVMPVNIPSDFGQ